MNEKLLTIIGNVAVFSALLSLLIFLVLLHVKLLIIGVSKDCRRSTRLIFTVLPAVFYLALFYIHFRFPSFKLGVGLAVIFLVCLLFCFRTAKQHYSWQRLILYFMLLFFLVVPTYEYKNVILDPLKNIKKAGPLEFFNISEFSSPTSIDSFKLENLTKNYINNGGFEIPLIGKDSKWGTGYYSNQIKSLNPDVPVYFMKFGGAVAFAEISQEEHIKGNYSLYIRHESSEQNNSVGLLEQEIYLLPGEYELSLRVKANYMIGNAVWIRLESKKWFGTAGIDIGNIRSSSGWNLYKRYFKVHENGEISYKDDKDWIKIDRSIKLTDRLVVKDNAGKEFSYFVTTFSIISTNQCEVWIDDIILTKIAGSNQLK